MFFLIRFLGWTLLMGVPSSCSSDSDSGNSKQDTILAITGGVQINIANKGDFSLEGTCAIEGAQITATLGSFSPLTTNCTNLNWKVSVDASIVNQMAEGTAPLSVAEAGNSTPVIAEVQKDITAPTFSFAENLNINVVNQGQYSLSGTCGEAGIITVTVATLPPVTATCDGANWSTTGVDVSSLGNGVNSVTLSASMVDAAGNPGSAQSKTVTKDTNMRVVVVGSLLVINSSNKTTYEVSGTCSPHTGNVTVTLVSGQTVTQTPACQNGRWQTGAFDVSSLNDGSIAVSATFGTGAEKVPDSGHTVVKDTVVPTFSFAANLNINAVNQGQYSLSGTCGEAGTITVTVATLPPVTATCDGANWSTTGINVSSLGEGVNSVALSASMVDVAGNPSPSQSKTVTKDTLSRVVVVGPLLVINSSNKTTYEVSGTCSPHTDNVTVTLVSGQTVIQTPVCQNGRWQTGAFDVSSLNDGSVAVSATFGTGAEKAQDSGHIVVKDTMAPTIAIATDLSAINKANQGSYTVSGTCNENGATVTVAVGELTARSTTCTSNAWSLSDYNATGATGSRVSITASIADRYQNSRSAPAVSIDRDIVAPTVTITSTNLHINGLNKASYSLTGGCEVGLPVALTIGNITPQSLTCNSADSTWSLTSFNTSALAEGTNYNLVASQTDAAGNVGSGTQVFDKDITAPIVSITTQRYVNLANQSNFTIRGSCSDSGQKVSVTVASGAAVEVDCASSRWAYSSINLSNAATFPEGIIAVSIAHQDKSGNMVTVNDATTQLTKDVTAPIVTIDALTEISASTNLQSYAVSGNCSEASVSVVVDASGVSPTTHPICGASSNGKWSTTVDISALGGTVFFNAQQVDAAGNRGSASGRTIEVVRLYFEHQTLVVGGGHSCAVTKDKKVLCWGNNEDGELGDDSNTARGYPVYVVDGNGSISHLTDIIEVAAGRQHNCALKSNGKVLCWGKGNYGRLGYGGTQDRDHPVYVKMDDSTNLSDIVQVTAGEEHTCALNAIGKVLCWGKDNVGQLGNGSITGDKNYSIYVHESESSSSHLTSMVQVKSGKEHTCALSTARKVYCWGRGNSGQLGSSNPGVNRFAPRAVLTERGGDSLSGILEISPGGTVHSCALLQGGKR